MRVVLFCFWLALDWRFGGCVALDGRPNVVLLLADDMGLPDVGSYYDALRAGPFGDEAVGDVDKLGRGRPVTPELDRMAAQGVRLENFRVASPVCSPSRVAFMTGVEPSALGFHNIIDCWPETVTTAEGRVVDKENGVRAWFDPFERDAATSGDASPPFLTRVLAWEGYFVGHFGKHHMGCTHSPPAAFGINVSRTWASPGVEYGWPEFAQYHVGSGKGPHGQGWRFTEKWRLVHGIADETVALFDAARGGPFYANVWFPVPHSPLSPSRRELEAVPEDGCDLAKLRLPFASAGRPSGPGPWVTQCANRVYKASVWGMDEQIGRLRRELAARKLERSTLVVFCADNGPEVRGGNLPWSQVGQQGPFRGRKRSAYDGGVRSPFIAVWPGTIEPHRVDRRDVRALDWFKTVLRLAKPRTAAARDALDEDGEEEEESEESRERASPSAWSSQQKRFAALRRGGRDASHVLLQTAATAANAAANSAAVHWEWGFSAGGACEARSPRFATARRDDDLVLLFEGAVIDRNGSRGNVLIGEGRCELFNVTQDPRQLVNLASELPREVDELKADLVRWLATLPATIAGAQVLHKPCPPTGSRS